MLPSLEKRGKGVACSFNCPPGPVWRVLYLADALVYVVLDDVFDPLRRIVHAVKESSPFVVV